MIDVDLRRYGQDKDYEKAVNAFLKGEELRGIITGCSKEKLTVIKEAFDRVDTAETEGDYEMRIYEFYDVCKEVFENEDAGHA